MSRSQVEEIWEVLTEDGGVQKKVIEAGDGPAIPERPFVRFRYDAYLKDKPDEKFDSTSFRNLPENRLLEKVTPLGLMIALRTMRRGERCRVVFRHEYGYSKMGCPPHIPPMATLVYDVHLLSFIEAEPVDDPMLGLHSTDVRLMPFDTVYEWCAVRLSNGNWFYDAWEFSTALECFALASRYMGWTSEPADQDGRNKRKRMLIMLHANEAQCALRARDPKRAVQCARLALKLDPEYVKALYRCGVGLRLLGEVEDAAFMQRRAFELAPGSRHVMRELVLIEQHLHSRMVIEADLRRRLMRDLAISESRPLRVAGEEREERRSRLAIEYALDAKTRDLIRRALEALAKAPAGTELPLEANTSREEIDYVRLLCSDMGFTVEQMPGGWHKVRR